ncbi:MAG: hypothetical protein Q9227_000450 [Pyrenula ochraceoflavens]
MDATLTKELAKLDPSIPFRAQKRHLHHTWAKTYFSRPEIYVQPHSVAEIQKVVTLARRCHRRLVTVGAGHSPSDLTCTSSWMINLDNFNRILEVDKNTRLVTCESGISVHDLGIELSKHGLSLPNIGSIDNQSIAGALGTATHGSSLWHGILPNIVTGLALMLANGQVVRCSKTSNPDLFRAALVSLGALGVITEVTFKADQDFKIEWEQTLQPLPRILENWDTSLWTTAEFTRVWWMPYLNSAVVWRANKTDKPLRDPPSSFYGEKFGFHLYHTLLWVSNYFPSLLPLIEWGIFGLQYGFKEGSKNSSAIQPGRQGLLMNCLYSQFVNEWALPLEKGPEAIERLSAWLHGDETRARIPVSSKGIYVHSPVEVRVADTSKAEPRPFLDNTSPKGPTLFLNATLYRPYNRDPPCRKRYYEAFEYLMREMGARPHWAKNFTDQSAEIIPNMYGEDMERWVKVRNESDPSGMFLGAWHRRCLPLGTAIKGSLEETKIGERSTVVGDGREWLGHVSGANAYSQLHEEKSSESTPSPPMTAASEESFDYLAKGEASVYASKD